MPERRHPDQDDHEFDSPVAGETGLESPLPGLEAMLREAADDASGRALVPPYGVVEGLVRRRRAARVATAGVFGIVLILVVGVAAVSAVGPDRDGRPQPAASATALDPSLRAYWTKIPVLSWTPRAGAAAASELDPTDEFRTAVFSALGPGDHDYSDVEDLRECFPDAPVGGPAVIIDQSVTKAELERAAANLRKLDDVQEARVVEVSGLWFTVSATAPATAPAGTDRVWPPVMDTGGLGVGGSASGLDWDAQHRRIHWVRTTYVGPAIDRATFDLMRVRAAKALHIDVSQVVVTAESADRKPEPTTS